MAPGAFPGARKHPTSLDKSGSQREKSGWPPSEGYLPHKDRFGCWLPTIDAFIPKSLPVGSASRASA